MLLEGQQWHGGMAGSGAMGRSQLQCAWWDCNLDVCIRGLYAVMGALVVQCRDKHAEHAGDKRAAHAGEEHAGDSMNYTVDRHSGILGDSKRCNYGGAVSK